MWEHKFCLIRQLYILCEGFFFQTSTFMVTLKISFIVVLVKPSSNHFQSQFSRTTNGDQSPYEPNAETASDARQCPGNVERAVEKPDSNW